MGGVTEGGTVVESKGEISDNSEIAFPLILLLFSFFFFPVVTLRFCLFYLSVLEIYFISNWITNLKP